MAQRTRLTGRIATAPRRPRPSHEVQHAVASAADGEDHRRDRRCEGERDGAGEVEHAEILGGVVLVGQHVDNEASSTATYMPKPRPPIAIPTRNPLKLLASAITNIDRP